MFTLVLVRGADYWYCLASPVALDAAWPAGRSWQAAVPLELDLDPLSEQGPSAAMESAPPHWPALAIRMASQLGLEPALAPGGTPVVGRQLLATLRQTHVNLLTLGFFDGDAPSRPDEWQGVRSTLRQSLLPSELGHLTVVDRVLHIEEHAVSVLLARSREVIEAWLGGILPSLEIWPQGAASILALPLSGRLLHRARDAGLTVSRISYVGQSLTATGNLGVRHSLHLTVGSQLGGQFSETVDSHGFG